MILWAGAAINQIEVGVWLDLLSNASWVGKLQLQMNADSKNTHSHSYLKLCILVKDSPTLQSRDKLCSPCLLKVYSERCVPRHMTSFSVLLSNDAKDCPVCLSGWIPLVTWLSSPWLDLKFFYLLTSSFHQKPLYSEECQFKTWLQMNYKGTHCTL